ncbi:hypothetical protein KR222_008132 [Zaprionus bogoriensis]|nr:hypothetical protein KR222_008132 [Zaprionus bogoriensis]
MLGDTNDKLQDYKYSLFIKAEVLVTKGIAEKILELSELLENLFSNELNNQQDLHIPVSASILVINQADANKDSPQNRDNVTGVAPALGVPVDTVPYNKTLCDMIEMVKPIIRKLIDDSNQLKMWIALNNPKTVEDNQFRVSMQEEIFDEIQIIKSEAAQFYDQTSQYFLSRARAVSKVSKYPQLEDYRRAIVELDENKYLSLWLVVCEVRNRYLSLYDIVNKNQD